MKNYIKLDKDNEKMITNYKSMMTRNGMKMTRDEVANMMLRDFREGAIQSVIMMDVMRGGEAKINGGVK
jgi:hypothetical protein